VYRKEKKVKGPVSASFSSDWSIRECFLEFRLLSIKDGVDGVDFLGVVLLRPLEFPREEGRSLGVLVHHGFPLGLVLETVLDALDDFLWDEVPT